MFSWSSLTKLWERIFDLRSQKNFFDTQSWHVENFSHIGSVTLRGKFQIWVKNFDENFFFNKIFLCSLIHCAHVLNHLKTVKSFHSRISTNYRHVKDSMMVWDFFKDFWKMSGLSQKFRWKVFFSSKFFLVFITMQTCFRSSRGCGKLS